MEGIACEKIGEIAAGNARIVENPRKRIEKVTVGNTVMMKLPVSGQTLSYFIKRVVEGEACYVESIWRRVLDEKSLIH